jgi:hypothetical protein
MRKCLGILLMVCLIASSAFATNSWTASTGSWGTATGWSRGWVPSDTEQVKINGGTTCTLDVDAGTFAAYKVTVGTTTSAEGVLNIVNPGALISGLEIQVGDSSGYLGRVNQSGGTVSLPYISGKASKLEVGYKQGVGNYTISGGTIAGDSVYSQLQVGASGATGGNGTFTVSGTGGSINIAYLYVGASTATAQYTGTGTMAFEINGGVSAINAGSVYIDPTDAVAAVANLSVAKTGALPTGNIILINNTGVNAVTGEFDNYVWGSTVTVGGLNYTLTNTYIGGVDGLANDIALVIPEPATIALLGLGLLAIRRNKK